jgi:hypothetical protein
MYNALDSVIATIVRYIKKQIKPGKQTSAILVTGGFSRSGYLMRKLKEEFEPRGITVIRPSDTDTTQCYPVAVGALLRWENITNQDLPERYGYAILQQQYFDDECDEHKDSWSWDAQSESRITKPWVKASPYDPNIDIVDDRVKTIIARGEQFKDSKSVEMEFRIPVDDPHITAEFVYLTRTFKDSEKSQRLPNKIEKLEAEYARLKDVHDWAIVNVVLPRGKLEGQGFEQVKLEDGDRRWVLNVRVVVRKISHGMDVEFHVLKPYVDPGPGGKDSENDAFKEQVAFVEKGNLYDRAHSHFLQ